MLRFLKKRRKSSKKLPVPPESPAHKTADIGAEVDRGPEDTDRGEGFRVVNQGRRTGNQQLLPPNISTLTHGHEGGNARLQGRVQIHGGSVEAARSEQLGPNTLDRNTAGREHKGHGLDVRQHSEAASERRFGAGQDGGDADDVVRSGRSRVKERSFVDRNLGRVAFAVELAKGPAEAFAPLKAVLASISGVYAQYQNTITVKDKIEVLRSRIATLEKLFEQSASDEKETKLREGLLTKLEAVEEQLRPLSGKSAPLRYLDNSQDSEDVSGLLEDLQEAVNNYMMAQQMAIYDQGCKLMDAAEKSVLNNFRCARGAEYRHGGRKGCLKGTRGATLSGIELWARDFDRSPVYWLNGLAGAGKSTIAKTIAERLFVDGQLGASFFCSRDFEDRRNLQLIFPTLATQLARKYIEFRSILTPLIQSDPNIAYESLYDQMKKLIVQPLNESKISTVIVIDALDECEDEESASAILSVLGRLVSETPKVKFFLTGRPESRISEGFRLPLLVEMTDTFILHGVEPNQVDNDIRLFFKTSFSELAGRRRGLDNWPTEEQLDQLCRRAEGLFVYAAATVKFIDNNKRDPKKQLDLLLRSQKIGSHEGRALDSLYTSILREAFGDDKPGDDAKTRSVLGAVVLAANPLSPSAIAMLLGFDTEDVSLLLSSVSSVLILQEDVDHPVRPFHKSFPDFITDLTRCTNLRFHISPPEHHAQLLIGCLNLMNRTLEKNLCKLPDSVANSDVGDLKERTERYINTALRYACVSWNTHFVNIIDADTTPIHAPTITPALRQFLEAKFLFWLEVLSVLGVVKNAVEALQATADWFEGSPTFDLANDCFRFVTGYFEIISASSPHIYHSALVVAPKNSAVRKLYESYAHPFTRVVRGVQMSWRASTVAAARPSNLESVVWSPCNRFIAITWRGTKLVDLLDSTTLQRLQTLESPQDISTEFKALVFSPDSRILTCSSCDLSGRPDRELFVVSWDIQTGGVANIIRWPAPNVTLTPSITYSANGKIVGVFYCDPDDSSYSDIFICDVISGILIQSHSLNGTILPSDHTWTPGESLCFATVYAKAITVWEIVFTSGATPTEVETLPTPDGFDDFDNECTIVQLLPALCRLALIRWDPCQVLVWDARNSRYLLECMDAEFSPETSFSSDGRFFACSTTGSDIHLWKESPAGYIPHGIFTSSATTPVPLFAPNGESIVAFSGCAIQLWHTLPSSLTRTYQRTEDFILEFSLDGMLAVVAMRKDNTVTVLSLKSGTTRLTIDACMEVYGLGVIQNTVVVIGDRKVITWNLPVGDCVPGACVGLEDSSWTMDLDGWQHEDVRGASISPDSSHIALTTIIFLYIYSTSTGERLGQQISGGFTPRFSPDGRHVWRVDGNGKTEVWRVSGEEVLELLEPAVDVEHPPEGYPWRSPRGCRVTDDWWILGPDGKRLLLLPSPWQSFPVFREWKGPFLALLHGGLPEPVILELEENRDLRYCP